MKPAKRKRTGQSKRQSTIETSTNLAVGYILAFVMYQAVMPLFGYNVTLRDNAVITSMFTVVSFVRGYLLRRIFNHIHEQRVDSLRELLSRVTVNNKHKET